MPESRSTVDVSLERIAIALETIALFLQVVAEDQTPVDEAHTANTVMTQTGPIELR